jgi:hypothetical protein
VVQEDGTGGFVVVVAAATVVSVEDVLAGLVRIGSFVELPTIICLVLPLLSLLLLLRVPIAATTTIAFNVNQYQLY